LKVKKPEARKERISRGNRSDGGQFGDGGQQFARVVVLWLVKDLFSEEIVEVSSFG
jgi:hypothetical protein